MPTRSSAARRRRRCWPATTSSSGPSCNGALAAPISVLVLVLLALPLAKSSPREPRYARLLLALLAWFIYYNCLALGRAWISQGRYSPLIGFWWVQVPTALIALLLLWQSQRLPRPRPARALAKAGGA